MELKQAIQEVIETDRLIGQKLKDILLNGPCDAAKGLQEWNLEDGLILYKGLVYVPITRISNTKSYNSITMNLWDTQENGKPSN